MGHLKLVEDNSQKDAYVRHLSEVNEAQQVVASEDIYNAQGILLIKKGQFLDEKAAKRIVQYKLLKPLEENVALENDFCGNQLFDYIINLIAGVEEFRLIHESLNIEDELKELCIIYNSYPLLVQKMTVMSIQLPKTFRSGVASACLSLSIAHRLHMDFEAKKVVFLAGLVHDIGMLHIDPAIVKKEGKFEPDEWRTMQAHAVIGYKTLDEIPRLPEGVAMAVLEHHERTDGAGYPKGSVGRQLSLEGQIVAMSDSVFAIYTNRLVNAGHSFKEVLPVVQMNSRVHFYHVYQAFVAVLNGANLPDKRRAEGEKIASIADRTVQDFYQLLAIHQVGEPLVKNIPRGTNFKQLNIALSMLERIYNSISSSGILLEQHLDWLLAMKNTVDDEECLEVERASLMHTEIQWQMHQLYRTLHSVLTEHPAIAEEVKKVIYYFLTRVEEIEKEREMTHEPELA